MNKSSNRGGSIIPLVITSIVLIVAYYAHSYINRHKMAARRTRYSNFADAIADKAKADEHWLSDDRQYLYHIDPSLIQDQRILSKMITMDHQDEQTNEFISNSIEKSDAFLTQVWHNVAKSVLKLFYTQTDVNGYLQRGSMFVFSQKQFEALLEKAGIDKQPHLGTLIDLGAGDGRPTLSMSTLFHKVYATEASWSMRSILESKGFEIVAMEEWDSRQYDTISCLNLLDRCETPRTVIQQMKKALKPDGFIVVALVLPFNPFVEFANEGQDNKPVEKLAITGQKFEHQIEAVVRLFEGAGFDLRAWTRLPYLCEGDMSNSVYVLNDSLFIFKHSDLNI